MKKTLSVIALSTLFATSAFAQQAATAVETPATQAQESQKEYKRGEHHGKHKGDYKSEKKERHSKVMEEVDTNKDGKVSKEESLAFAEKRFEKMDANKDGFITKDEIKKPNKDYKQEKREKTEDKK